MTVGPLFLHGGGASPGALHGTLGRFVAAARARGDGPILMIIHASAAADLGAYRDLLSAAGGSPQDLASLVVSTNEPPTAGRLVQLRPAVVFVCGGLTPAYHDALCMNPSWVDYLRDAGLPYGGTSAGAAVAAERAILGGWRVRRGTATAQILFPGAGEGLELLEVRPGLALISGSVDVHASQSGTLTRLLHAVESGQTEEGWGIDEDTLLEVAGGRVSVWGDGQVYRVRRGAQGAHAVAILTAGSVVALNTPSE